MSEISEASDQNVKARLLGKYIAYSGKALGEKRFEAISISNKDFLIPANEYNQTSYPLGSTKGKTRKVFQRDSIRFEAMPGWPSVLLEDLRIIPPDGQAYLADCDFEIKEAYEKIKRIESLKKKFIQDHFLGWEIAKFEDVVAPAQVQLQLKEREEQHRKSEDARKEREAHGF